MADFRLGLDCVAYRNTGSYATPTWDELTNVKEVTVNLDKAEADVTTRGNSGWRAVAATLKDGSVDVTIQHNPDSHADVTALLNAWLNNTQLECAFMDGPVATSGSEGLRGTFEVMSASRSEPLEDGVVWTFSLKPSLATNAPEWLVVA